MLKILYTDFQIFRSLTDYNSARISTKTYIQYIHCPIIKNGPGSLATLSFFQDQPTFLTASEISLHSHNLTKTRCLRQLACPGKTSQASQQFTKTLITEAQPGLQSKCPYK